MLSELLLRGSPDTDNSSVSISIVANIDRNALENWEGERERGNDKRQADITRLGPCPDYIDVVGQRCHQHIPNTW